MSEVVEEKVEIPPQCKECLWIKDNKCRYEGLHYDEFNEDIYDDRGLNGCHSTVEDVKEVDWSEYK